MKKKGTILAGLLLATIVTGYSVAGTYARYTSSIDLTDEARVAKWEFKGFEADGTTELGETIDLFNDSYVNNGRTYVRSFTKGQNVVAPGTKGDYTIRLKGQMETMFKLDFNLVNENDFVVYFTTKTVEENGKSVLVVDEKKANTDVIVAEDGTVTTKGDSPVTIKNADGVLQGNWKEYHPIRYTLSYGDFATIETTPTVKLEDLDITSLKTALKTYNDNNAKVVDGKLTHVFNPTDSFDKGILISWEWATENENYVTGFDATTGTQTVVAISDRIVNALDTYAGEKLSTEMVKFGVKVTATQVTADDVADSSTTSTFGKTDSEKYSKKN